MAPWGPTLERELFTSGLRPLGSPTRRFSMTINGPAPIMLAFFFQHRIDQQVEKFEKEKGGR